jgi:hypothetical protein
VGNRPFFFLLLLVTCLVHPALAQLETATVSGQVVDPSGLGITGAHVQLVDIDRDTSTIAITNNSGLYTFASVRPGRYRMEVDAAGFRIVNVTGLTLNVQDHVEQNFRLQIGSVAESVTVEANSQQVNTTDATVSTVVDRQFAENLPLNGRSFQTLIQLTPGVVLTPSNTSDSGQFSINGQRAASNYWMVDGVSANIGIGVNSFGSPGNGLAGSLGSFSALGGTNSLVSVDAMQEFRIQTSTYAPEFGRTPGGQISIVTRSGTNQFHGTAFDYLRNDAFDANNWFNGYTNDPPLPKARERQNDFGGTFSGPILKERTFFFFSYEGLRLRLPQTTLTTVPDFNSRQTAVPAMQPYLNAFPLPNGPEDPVNAGAAQLNASYSDPAMLDAYSLRIDHRLNDKWSFFGRYNYSPSQIIQRGSGGFSLNTISSTRITTQTATMGLTWTISPTILNDLRFNYSRTNASSSTDMDNFGGAIPLVAPPFPTPYTDQNASFQLGIFSLLNSFISLGKTGQQLQRQLNLVDNVSIQRRSHSLKFGVDFRRLTPLYNPALYSQAAYFSDVPSAETGALQPFSFVASSLGATFLFRNLGLYGQDTWRVDPHLTVTYGVRWDIDFVPTSLNGPSLPAVTGFNLINLSNLALSPAGVSPYATIYNNLAPRVGLAYQLSQNRNWQSVIRGGFGVFYDLATSEVGNAISNVAYPFGSEVTVAGTFPLSSAMSEPPSIAPPNTANPGGLLAFDPHLQLPYTLEWNVALEQRVGEQQTVSASYVGAAGHRLLQTAVVTSPNPYLSFASLVTNAGTSDYDALQLQFQRRLARGLQALASYTWSHSIDTGSAGSTAVLSNALVPAAISANRGPSDFDIRNAFSAAITYEVPTLKLDSLTNTILRGWSTDNIVQAFSAPPINVSDANFLYLNGVETAIRPDLVPGQPYYLYGAQCAAVLQVPMCPGHKAFNPAAFTNPPVDPATGNPLQQGNVPRNFLRGFGAAQWDFAVHRDFPIREALRLQFRAEMFNVLNHPNFGQPSGAFGEAGFGLSTQTLGQYLNGGSTGTANIGGGALSPLYQLGGPRSIQFGLKLSF